MYPNQNQQQQQGGFGFDVNQYEAQQAFDTLPPAWYNIYIEDAEMKALQSGKGTMCANVYNVFGGPFADRKLFDNLNIIHENEQAQDIARRALRSIQDALGKQSIAGPWDLKGGYMCVKVGLDKPKKDATEAEKAAFEPRNVIRGYKPFDQALHQQNQQQPAQGYNVQVQPNGPAMGNGTPNFAPQSPQFAQQPMQQQAAPQFAQQQAPQQMQQQQPQVQQAAPQQQFNPNQQQQQPQQQAAPQGVPQGQPQQPNFQQTGSMPPGAGNSDQQGQQQNAPGAMAQDGGNSQNMAAPSAGFQNAPPATFAPQQQGGNTPPPPGPSQQVEQPQQMQQAPQPQMAQPSQQFAPPAGQAPQQQQGGNTPPPPAAW